MSELANQSKEGGAYRAKKSSVSSNAQWQTAQYFYEILLFWIENKHAIIWLIWRLM